VILSGETSHLSGVAVTTGDAYGLPTTITACQAATHKETSVLQRLRAARKNQNGFTLIELLIVIVILGVLAGVVVLAVSGINNRGVVAACDADKRTVMTAVEAYYAEFSAYPPSTPVDPLVTLSDSDNRMQWLVKEDFLKERPGNDKGYVITLDEFGDVTAVANFC
jgi:general secretion pathway protein G